MSNNYRRGSVDFCAAEQVYARVIHTQTCHASDPLDSQACRHITGFYGFTSAVGCGFRLPACIPGICLLSGIHDLRMQGGPHCRDYLVDSIAQRERPQHNPNAMTDQQKVLRDLKRSADPHLTFIVYCFRLSIAFILPLPEVVPLGCHATTQ